MSRLTAEQSVIGGVLLAGQSAYDEVAHLKSEMFTGQHAEVWAAIQKLAINKTQIDAITVSDAVGDESLVYLVNLANNTPTATNVRSYGALLIEHYAKDRIITAVADTINNSEGLGSVEVATKIAADLNEVLDDTAREADFVPVDQICQTIIDKLEARIQGQEIPGIKTGFVDLDASLGDIEPGHMVVLAARPAMGKTSLAMNIIENVCQSGKRAIFLSLEMTKEQLITRLIASAGKFNSSALRTEMQDQDWPRFNVGVQKVRAMRENLFIADQSRGTFTPGRLSAFIKSVNRKYGAVDAVFVDYLQLLKSDSKAESRVNEISDISRSLKLIAQLYKCPVIALSQLNRDLEKRVNKRPVMSDLRESGAIEQDADSILFIYRDEVYNENSVDKGVAEVIVGKNRHGSIGTVRMAFVPGQTRFADLGAQY